MIVFIAWTLAVILVGCVLEEILDAIIRRIDAYVPRRKRGYPRIKSLV